MEEDEEEMCKQLSILTDAKMMLAVLFLFSFRPVVGGCGGKSKEERLQHHHHAVSRRYKRTRSVMRLPGGKKMCEEANVSR